MLDAADAESSDKGPKMTADKQTRRDLLQAASILGLGVSLTGCEGRDEFAPNKPPVPGSAGWLRGEERQVATSCGQCDAGCGVLVRVVEGRVVRAEGNPDCPINRGGIGPRGLSAPQVLYDPDRIRGPLLSVGPRGSGEWREIGWEEGRALLEEKLGEVREGAGPEALGILCGRERGLVRELWERFASVYGTPNLLDASRSDDGAERAAFFATQGIDDLPAYDWERTRLVLSLGSGVLDASCQILHFARIRDRERGGAGRARIVHVGPALSRTAMNADDWISARMGTNGVFALGLAHVLVRDELYDVDFVREHSLGFDPWTDAEGREHRGFRSLLEDYGPKRVAEICDVPAPRIEAVAHLMAATRPCFALGGPDELKASNGVQTAMAVQALNALLGVIDRPGGVLVQAQAPLAEWGEPDLDEVAEQGLGRAPILASAASGGSQQSLLGAGIDALPDALLGEGPYDLRALLIDHANPLFSRAQSGRWREALAKVPFVVSFSPFMDETTSECADLVLPDDTWLERWGDSGSAPSLGRAVFGLRQPVVERLHDTRSTGDVIIEVARSLGESVAEAFPWKDYRSALKKRLIGLYKSKTGSIIESKGSTFLKRLYREGFWAGEDYVFEQWERVLRTPSGRFEFFSSILWERLAAAAESAGLSPEEFAHRLAGVEDPDLLCLPFVREFEEVGDPEHFPLLLAPYKPHTYARGSGANLPWLNELAPWRGRSVWCTEAELHPRTAAEHGLRTGDRIAIESCEGTVDARTYVTPGVRPGLVRIALGAGHTAFGRYAKGWGANVMKLVSAAAPDPLGGSSALQGTRVAIRRNRS